jgi:transposase
MDVLYRCCAGADVHKRTVVVCIRRVEPDGRVTVQVRTFFTTTAGLLERADWLAAAGVTHLAIESTGVYWKPVFNILEGQLEVLLVNARHVKNVPGRKTDVKDAEWLAQLLAHGLLRPSLIPPPPVRDLRDLTRQRTQLVRDRAAVANRIQKVLEDANIKLAGVASDVLGVSGRAMIRGLIAGEDDPAALAERARKRLRKKIPQLRAALHGRVTGHHRFLLRMHLGQIEYLEGQIAAFGARIEEAMGPFAAAVARLRTIPGVGAQAAEVIVAETGADMSRFPTAGHLASWAGLCPGNNQSAGKSRSGKTTKGSQWLRTALVQVAWAAVHGKATMFGPRYSAWAKRMGRKKALVAVAHKILRIIHKLLRDQTDYVERSTLPEAA